jgi:hypothetical protein
VLRPDLLDELGVLGIIDVSAKRNLLDGQSAWNGPAFQRVDMIRLAEECLLMSTGHARTGRARLTLAIVPSIE